MSKEYLFLGVIVVLIILTALFEFQKPKAQNTPRLEKEENNVTVAVTYLPQKSDDKSTNLEVTLDTHSVDLDSFNFQKDVILEASGKTKTPQKVEEEGATHHRKAKVTFEKTEPPFNIIILNLENIPRRQFQFED